MNIRSQHLCEPTGGSQDWLGFIAWPGRFGALMLGALLWGVWGNMPHVQAASPPNLLFVLSDDHRNDLLGCAGHPVVQTPSIDRLAADGVRFENAFVTTSICAASRATIFTGLTERSHGYTFGTPKLHRDWVSDSYPTLLRQHGYRTGFVGKFGVRIEGKPNQEMFDRFQPIGRTPYVKSTDTGPRHAADLIGDWAIDFIASSKSDSPFCLSVSFNAAHAEDNDKANHYPPAEPEKTLYLDSEIDQPRLVDTFGTLPPFLQSSMNRDRWYWRWDTPEKYDRNLRNYYRLLTGLDRNVGRMIDALQASGQADDTVVIFMGDNGYYKGDRGLAGKWSHFEESLRVPLILFDPRSATPNASRVSESIVLNLDIAPTLLGFAGIEAPKHYQGASLEPFAKQQRVDWPREAFTCEHLMDHPSIPKWQGIRTQRFSYANYFEQDPPFEFLHDRQLDPDQRKNCVDDPSYREIVADLRSRSTAELTKQESIRRRPMNTKPSARQ